MELDDLKLILLMTGIEFKNSTWNTTLGKRTIYIYENQLINDEVTKLFLFNLLAENNFQYRIMTTTAGNMYEVNKRIGVQK
jgi:hypothetical protein